MITGLPTDHTKWKFVREHRGPPFGVFVTASTGSGDNLASFELCDFDGESSVELAKAHKEAGFPENIVDEALELYNQEK